MEAQQDINQESNDQKTSFSSQGQRSLDTLKPQQADKPCPTCGSSTESISPSFIYALGKIELRFRTLGLEKEFTQAAGRVDTKGLTDRQVLHEVLKQNRYLVRQMCWVFSVEGIETYILQPRAPADFDELVETIRTEPNPADIDVVIGIRGPIAPPEMCNGLMVPIVFFDKIYYFDRDSLIKGIPQPEGVSEAQFKAASEQVFDTILQFADNAGNEDSHRALNYLAVQYDAIYAATYTAFMKDNSFMGFEVLPSRLIGTRKILDVILKYTNRQTEVTEKLFVRVDVTEEFPFLKTKLSTYFDR